MNKIKTLIITDFMGAGGLEPEEEADVIARIFETEYDIKLDFRHETHASNIKDYDPKLVIIDYGGLMPGSDTDVYQVKEVVKWALDHPSRLVLIWTAFTARIWKFDLEDEFTEADNVLLWQPIGKDGVTFFGWDEIEDHQNKVTMMIRHWYDLPAPKPKQQITDVVKLKTPGRK